jgi:hypothetical protein
MSTLGPTQQAFFAGIVAPSAPEALPELAGDARAAASERLGIYRHAFVARCADALAEDFPALGAELGAEELARAAAGYARAVPSRHPSLRFRGEGFAAYLRSHPDARALRERAPWAPALAALEWALVDVFDAEDAAPLARAALAALPPGRWHALPLALVPAARLLALDWPVRGLRSAYAAGAPLPAAPTAPALERVLVWRQEERVFHRTLDGIEAALLARVVAGVSFGALSAEAAALRGDDAAGAALAASALARWVEDGLLRAADLDR